MLGFEYSSLPVPRTFTLRNCLNFISTIVRIYKGTVLRCCWSVAGGWSSSVACPNISHHHPTTGGGAPRPGYQWLRQTHAIARQEAASALRSQVHSCADSCQPLRSRLAPHKATGLPWAARQQLGGGGAAIHKPRFSGLHDAQMREQAAFHQFLNPPPPPLRYPPPINKPRRQRGQHCSQAPTQAAGAVMRRIWIKARFGARPNRSGATWGPHSLGVAK